MVDASSASSKPILLQAEELDESHKPSDLLELLQRMSKEAEKSLKELRQQEDKRFGSVLPRFAPF